MERAFGFIPGEMGIDADVSSRGLTWSDFFS